MRRRFKIESFKRKILKKGLLKRKRLSGRELK
jgi:hypothetical protein